MTNVTRKLTHYVKGDMETFGEKRTSIDKLEGCRGKQQRNVEHHAEKRGDE